MKKIRDISALVRQLFPESNISTAEIVAEIEEAYRSVDGDYGADQARVWGLQQEISEGVPFNFEDIVGVGDQQLFLAHNKDLGAMTAASHKKRDEDSLNAERVRKHVPADHPDFNRLLDLATEGARIPRDPSFRGGNPIPPLRNLYRIVAPAVKWMYYEEWLKGNCFLLPTNIATDIENRHYASIHHTRKKGKQCGRKLVDHSDASSGSCLNAGTSSDQAKAMYGELHHPSIFTIMDGINSQVDKHGADNISLFQTDIADAFGQLKISPGDVHLLLSDLGNGLTVCGTHGTFGLTGMPPTFGVVSRVVKSSVELVIRGTAEVYADDTCGVTHDADVDHDLAAAEGVIRNILGKDSVNPKKSLKGKILTFLGWLINCHTQTVSIGKENYYKLLYGFYAVDISRAVSIKVLQQLSGRVARYQLIIRPLRGLTPIFFAAHGVFGEGKEVVYRNRNVHLPLASEMKMAMWIWQASIIYLGLRGAEAARSFDSFRLQTTAVTVQFDASLTGLGILLTDDASGGLMGGGRADFPFDLLKDSSYQNSCEFIAVTLAVVAIARAGRSSVGIRLIGDSVAALSWSNKESWKGHLSRSAAVVFLLVCVAFDIHVAVEEHIAGVLNVACDDMSRGIAPEVVGVPLDRVVDIVGHKVSRKLLGLCDPRTVLDSRDKFVALWQEVQSCVKVIRADLVTTSALPIWADQGTDSSLAAAAFPSSLPDPNL